MQRVVLKLELPPHFPSFLHAASIFPVDKLLMWFFPPGVSVTKGTAFSGLWDGSGTK